MATRRLGQAVADGLELGDRPAELDPLEGVLAGQLEHRARRADELVAERRAGRAATASAQPTAGVGGAGRRRVGRRPRPARARDRRRRPAASVERGGRHRRRATSLVAGRATTTSGASAVGERRRCPGRATRSRSPSSRPGGAPPAERRAARRRRSASASSAERAGDARGRAPTRWRRPRPAARTAATTAARGSSPSASCQPELVERGVERGARCARSVAWREAALEQLEVVAVHQRSLPRSSRRRAMMLRWISALPP